MTLHTIEEIREANHRAGLYYFSPDTMRFFKSRVSSRVYPVSDGAYFVTSEKGPNRIRAYSVRLAKDSGKISTVGEFQEYRSRSGAHSKAFQLQLQHQGVLPR
jgi:hypothetical protein